MRLTVLVGSDTTVGLVEKTSGMIARSVSLVTNGIGSAASALGVAVAFLVGVGLAGLVVNWTMILAVVPSGGSVRFWAQVLVFGVLFPIAWVAAAKPLAVANGLVRLYRRNRLEVLTFLTGAIGREAGHAIELSPERMLAVLGRLREHLEEYPRTVRLLLQVGLSRLPIAELETALRTRSGPTSVRLAEAIADHIEAELVDMGSHRLLWLVLTANALAYLIALLVW